MGKSIILIKRLHVTLVEMLLVLSILLLVAGVVSISAKRAFDEQRFRSEVNLIVNKLRFAQDLMLIYKGDVEVHFVSDGQITTFWLTSQHLSKGLWKDEIEHKHILKMSRGIGLEEGFNQEGKFGELRLQFKSNGSFMSSGILRIATADQQNVGALERFIVLSGYPQPITDTGTYPKNFSSNVEKEKEADTLLTRLTTEEVRDKL